MSLAQSLTRNASAGSQLKEDSMKSHSLNPANLYRTILAYRALRWIAADAVLGAACAALFGFAFGAIGLLLEAESWSIISVASYFALCGAAAGALVGACGSVLEGEDDSEQTRHSPDFSRSRAVPVVTSVNDPASPGNQSSHRLPRNRLFDVDRRGETTRESTNPSRN